MIFVFTIIMVEMANYGLQKKKMMMKNDNNKSFVGWISTTNKQKNCWSFNQMNIFGYIFTFVMQKGNWFIIRKKRNKKNRMRIHHTNTQCKKNRGKSQSNDCK